MTFGRWLLVHSFSISILAMLAIGYFYKDELKLNEAYKQLLQLDTSNIPSLDSSDIEPKVEKQVEEIDEDDSNIVLKQDEPVELEPNKTKEPIDTTPEKKSLDKIENLTVISTLSGTKESKPKDYLLLAREAFWNKDYQLSIDYYNLEIEKSPEIADLYGEVGNVYYGLKDFDSASDFYLKAGELFLNSSEEGRAKQIYDILLSIAPNKASTLLEIKNQQHQ